MKKPLALLIAFLIGLGGVNAYAAESTATVEDLFEQAIEAHNSGDAILAREFFTEAILLEPFNPACWLYCGVFADAAGDSASAYVDYGYALSLDKDPMVYILRSDLLQREERWQEVVYDCTMAIDLGTEESLEQALALRSHAYGMLGCINEALTDVELGLTLFPESLTMINARGILYYKQGEFEKAIADYQTALDQMGDQGVLYYNMAESLYLLNRDEEADAAAQKAASLSEMLSTKDLAKSHFEALEEPAPYAPASQREMEASGLRAQATEAYEKGDDEKALELFRQATLFYPEGPDAYYSCGFLYGRMGEPQKALEYFSFAISKNNGYTPCYNEMAQQLILQGRLQEAAVIFDRAIRLEPKNASLYYSYGIALYFSLHAEEALPFINEAIALDDGVALYYGGRGDLLLTLKRYEEAILDYEKCILLDPADEMAAAALEICKTMIESGQEEDAR